MKAATLYDVSGVTIARVEAIAKKFVIDDDTGCWNWIACKDKYGYGRVRFGNRSINAHRLITALVGRPAPAKLVCDHKCRNHACVNPKHLEAVTVKVNLERGINFWGQRTHCKHGHLFGDDSIRYRKNGKKARICKICEQLRQLKFKNKQVLLT